MLYVLKTLLSALMIVLATELSKRSTALAAILLSLPLVSVLAFIWMYVESGDTDRIARVAQETFWYVLPTLPMFLLMSYLLRNGYGFFLTLAVSVVVTAILFILTQAVVSRLG